MQIVLNALDRKWKKYVISFLVLIIISLSLFLYLLKYTTHTTNKGLVFISNGVLTADGKLFVFYIVMYFFINMSYAVFIHNRFEKYQKKLFQQYDDNEKQKIATMDNRINFFLN